MTTTTRLLTAALFVNVAALGFAQPNPVRPAAATMPKPVELKFEDQFGREGKLSDLRGRVVVMVYGDRSGNDACREYGEQLHVLFHPTAKGQPPEKARVAPVAPLAGVPAGTPSPDVVVVPVACTGNVPGIVKDMIQSGVAKASPAVTVWLDFAGAMEQNFGLKSGQTNVAVFDATGKPRMKLNGTPDAAKGQELVQTIQNLRAEAAGLSR
jgi:hypothetical protein